MNGNNEINCVSRRTTCRKCVSSSHMQCTGLKFVDPSVASLIDVYAKLCDTVF